MKAKPSTEANTPLPGPGSWRWDEAGACWLDVYLKPDPAQPEPAEPPATEPAPE